MKISPEILEAVSRLNITEDRKQDLYVKILEFGGTQPENYEGWLRTLYKNMLTDEQRQNARRNELQKENLQEMEKLHSTGDNADPLEYIEYEEMTDKVSKLTEKLFDVLLSHDVEGHSVEDIANAEGVAPSVIYTRLSRARNQLLKGC